jgi:UDP-N-acetylmuramyl pentapeptide synthase
VRDADAAADALAAAASAAATLVLVKGSRAVGLERVAEKLAGR